MPRVPPNISSIVIATSNPHKVEEIRAILGSAAPHVRFIGLADLDNPPAGEPIEDADSFEGNAAIKALWYAQRVGLPCLADDSGLEVDALEGAPGVYSARYASTDPSFDTLARDQRDARNNAKLLDALGNTPQTDRAARFICAMALAIPQDQCVPTIAADVRGTFEGQIGIPPRVPAGSNGFGYDPLFLVAPSFETTSAELMPEIKNSQSHRAAACHLMADHLSKSQ